MAPPRADWKLLSQQEQNQIGQAVYRGLVYLRRIQLPTGAWPNGADARIPYEASFAAAWPVGYTAMPGFTLLECGVPPNDPGVQRAARFVRLAAPGLHRTYEISLAVLFLSRLGEEADRDLLRSLALRLVAGQNATGGWGYTCPILRQGQEKALLKQMRQRCKALRSRPDADSDGKKVRVPEEGLKPGAGTEAVKGKKGAAGKGGRPKIKLQGDNSNTQFAILALWAARKLDLPLEATIAQIELRFRSTQLRGGGWGYGWGPNGSFSYKANGSMTCAGLLGLALGRAAGVQWQGAGKSSEHKRVEDPGIQWGLWALGGRLGDPRDGHIASTVNLYYLWSVERVGVLCGLKTIAGKDWYRWGATCLLLTQRADGSWNGGSAAYTTNPTMDTCMALLFLRQADLVPGLGEELRKRVVVTDPWLTYLAAKGKKGAKSPGDKASAKPAPQPEAGPLAVDLGEVKVGMPTERRITLRCATAFRVSAIAGTDRYLRAKVERNSQGEQVLAVTLQPSEQGELTRTLRLTTDLPGRREIEVTLKARAVP